MVFGAHCDSDSMMQTNGSASRVVKSVQSGLTTEKSDWLSDESLKQTSIMLFSHV